MITDYNRGSVAAYDIQPVNSGAILKGIDKQEVNTKGKYMQEKKEAIYRSKKM